MGSVASIETKLNSSTISAFRVIRSWKIRNPPEIQREPEVHPPEVVRLFRDFVSRSRATSTGT
jgi:hypothetical protein